MCVADVEGGDVGFVKKCCPEGEIIWPDMDKCVRVSNFGGHNICVEVSGFLLWASIYDVLKMLGLFCSPPPLSANSCTVCTGLSKTNGAKFRELSQNFPKLADWAVHRSSVAQ